MIALIIVSILLRYPVYRYVTGSGGTAYMDPEKGTPFLTEMDSYYHMRMTRDILQYGHPGDSVKDGSFWDSLSYAPDGRTANGYRPLMAYIAVYTYKLFSKFSSVTLDQIIYWQGMFISSLIIIPVFIFAYRLKGLPAAIIAAVLSSVNYGYFVHTVPGFSDTDRVNMWTSGLMFCLACIFIDSIEHIKKKGDSDKSAYKRIIIFGLVFAMSYALLILSWSSYYLFAVVLIISLILYILIRFIIAHKDSKKSALKDQRYLILTVLIVSIILFIDNPSLLKDAFSRLMSLKTSSVNDLFPNAYVSISELRKPALIAGGLTGLFQMKVLSGPNIGIINAVGGTVPFIGSIVMLILIIRRIIAREIRFEYVLLTVWFLITSVMAFRSWRFIMLFSIPVAILSGCLIGQICELMDKGRMMDRWVYKVMLFILMTFPALYGAYKSFADSVPIVNSALSQTMISIRESTPKDTILISWWDYGYFFEEKSERRTLFDGGSQSGIRCYFVSKSLVTPNETLSANISRMLSSSGDKAAELCVKTFGNDKGTLLLMDELLLDDRSNADRILSNKDIDAQTKDKILSLLFPDTMSPTEFIITPDMLSISGWFVDFSMYSGEETFDKSQFSAVLSQVPVSDLSGDANTLKTDYGFDLVILRSADRYAAYTINGGSEQPYHIDKVMVSDSNGYAEYLMSEAASDLNGWCVIIERHDDQTYLSLVTTPLADSVFGKMLFLRGAGLRQYEYDPALSNEVSVYNVKRPQ